MADTVKLFYEDPYLEKNDALVLSVRKTGDSGHDQVSEIVIDRTCFFPEGGGQVSDRGTINGEAVEYAYEEKNANGDAVVVHRMAGPSSIKAGDQVVCKIDFDARFQNMQDHTAQHILSESFIRTADLHTVSMHMGSDSMTIDLLITEKHGRINEKNFKLDRAVLDAAENMANSIVQRDLPIVSRLVDKSELAGLNLRKTPALPDEKVRLVSIKGFDDSLCCGTHLSSTGQAGVIKIIGQQKANGAVRIKFVNGMRALGDYRKKHYVLAEAAEYLSIESSDLVKSVEKLTAENRTLAKKKNELFDAYYTAVAHGFGSVTPLENGIYWSEPEGLEYGELARMGQIFSKAEGSFGFVLTATDASGFFRFVIGRTAKYPRDAKKTFDDIVAAFGARGGGNAMVAQGGGIELSRFEEFKNFVRTKFSL